MTLSQLKQLQNEGFEVVSHSTDHDPNVFGTGSNTSTVSQIDIRLKDSQKWIKDNGFNGYDVLVYPNGGWSDVSIRKKFKDVARKYYKHAIDSGSNYFIPPYDNMYIPRKFVDATTDFNTGMKVSIDNCIANNGMLIIGSHSGDLVRCTPQAVTQIIDYIQGLGYQILPVSQALELKGNAISIGDFDDVNSGFFVGKNGNVKIPSSNNVLFSAITSVNGLDASITNYTVNKVTYTTISGTADNLTTGNGGTLVTYRQQYYSFQLFHCSNNKIYYRYWSEGSNAWRVWVDLTDIGNVVVVGGLWNNGTRTMNDSITAYTKNKLTFTHISSSGDALTTEGGTMETYRGDDYYCFQRFVSATNCKVYYRKWNGADATGSWGAWKLVTTT